MRDIVMALTKAFCLRCSSFSLALQGPRGGKALWASASHHRSGRERVARRAHFNFFLTMGLNIIFLRATSNRELFLDDRGPGLVKNRQQGLRGVDLSVGKGETLVIIGRAAAKVSR